MSRRYQPLSPHHAATIAEHARRMRCALSATERLLWAELAGSRLGVAFRRQYLVGKFVVDFASPACKLIVEVDGGYHASRSRADAARDVKLRRLGWRVLRIRADVVLHNLPLVVALICAYLAGSHLCCLQADRRNVVDSSCRPPNGCSQLLQIKTTRTALTPEAASPTLLSQVESVAATRAPVSKQSGESQSPR
jgi:very-short-patch-repair endonuclease